MTSSTYTHTPQSQIPQIPGWPVLGNARDFLSRPMEFFLEAYHQVGPIFRIKVLHQNFVVMAGLEANRFLASSGAEHFTSEPLFGEFAQEMDTSNFVVALDGPAHQHMRKVLKRGYSKGNMGQHLDTFMALSQEQAHTWPVGQNVYIQAELQKLVTEQLGLALTRHSSREHFEAIRFYLSALMNVFAIKRWPRLVLYTPRYRRAKKSAMAFAKTVLDSHRQNPNSASPNLVDDLLKATDWQGKPLSEGDLLAATIGPFFAGLDTVASTMGFMLYAILKNPDIYAQIQAEVDEHFADGVPPWRELPKLKALYGTTLETLRYYPVAPFTPRGVLTPFEFGGHRVEVGEQVIIANTLTHYLPEFFPEPQKFDIERYQPPRQEHRQGAGIFAPYTLGAHTCLGAGAAEVQLMVTVGALIKSVELALPSPDYKLATKLLPIPSPDPKFQVHVLKHR